MTQRIQIVMVFIIMHLSIGYLVYPDLIYMLTKTAHWGVVMCQGFLLFILIWIYIKGLNYFPEKDVIDIYLKMGRWFAIIFLIPFVINLIALVAFNIRLHTAVIITVFLPRTPYWSVLILLFLISVYTAIKGLGTILRSSVFIFLIVIPLVVFNFFSSFINFEIHNVTPIWNLPDRFLLNSKFFYLLGFSSFLFLGFMAPKSKMSFRQLFVAFISAMLSFLSVVYTPLFIFGQETVVTLKHPFLEAMDTVDISWFPFNRLTMFFGISLVGLVIVANSVMLWMIGQIMRKILKRRKVTAFYWIIAVSIISFMLALLLPTQPLVEKCFLWSIGAQAYFMIIIPFSIFTYGFISKRGFRA